MKVLLEGEKFVIVQVKSHMHVLCPNCSGRVLELYGRDVAYCMDCEQFEDIPSALGHPSGRKGLMNPSTNVPLSPPDSRKLSDAVYIWWLEAWTGKKIERFEIS